MTAPTEKPTRSFLATYFKVGAVSFTISALSIVCILVFLVLPIVETVRLTASGQLRGPITFRRILGNISPWWASLAFLCFLSAAWASIRAGRAIARNPKTPPSTTSEDDDRTVPPVST